MDENIKILLVEDHLINQKVITHMIDKISNASVEAVSSGEEGLQRLRDSRFDLVLMDMQLEGISGLETIQAIRGFASGATPPDVPVAVLSGYSDAEKELEAKEAGANRYLLKPVDVEELRKLTEELRSASV